MRAPQCHGDTVGARDARFMQGKNGGCNLLGARGPIPGPRRHERCQQEFVEFGCKAFDDAIGIGSPEERFGFAVVLAEIAVSLAGKHSKFRSSSAAC